MTLDTDVCGDATKVLPGLNTPASPEGQTPPGGLCTSAILGGLCNGTSVLGPVTGGCATTGYACLPSEVDPTCIQAGGKGAYVVDQGEPTGKHAKFAGCCVTKRMASGSQHSGQTCKKVRVGRRYLYGGYAFHFHSATSGTSAGSAAAAAAASSRFTASAPTAGGSKRNLLTLPMNPLVQLSTCECFNLREHVSISFPRPRLPVWTTAACIPSCCAHLPLQIFT